MLLPSRIEHARRGRHPLAAAYLEPSSGPPLGYGEECRRVSEIRTGVEGPQSNADQLSPATWLAVESFAQALGAEPKTCLGNRVDKRPAAGVVVRRTGEPLAAQRGEFTRRPSLLITDEVPEEPKRELDVGGDRSTAEDRGPAQRDSDGARKDVLGALTGLEHETVLEPGRQREGVPLIRPGNS